MRRGTFLSSSIRLVRELERQSAAKQRGIVRQAAAQLRSQHVLERQLAATQKDKMRLHVESQISEASRMTEEVENSVAELENLLAKSLYRNPQVNFGALRRICYPPELLEQMPKIEDYMPPPLSLFSRLIPGANRRHQTRVSVAHDQFIAAVAADNEARAQ